MPKVRIQFITKNHSLVGNAIDYETTFIPRVGEIIDAKDYHDGYEHKNYMVVSVVYRMTGDGFIPFIAAREWYKGLRYELLENYGWLTPVSWNPPEHSYDEDIYLDLENK